MTNPRPIALSPALIAVVAILLVGALGVILMFALNLGFFAPSASPNASATLSFAPASGAPSTPRASSTSPAPSASTTPTTAPTPAGSLTPDQAFLLHVPEPIRPTCTLEGAIGSVVRTANCTADAGALQIAYSQYDTPESLANTFTGLRRDAQIEPDSGRCEDHATWPAEGFYRMDGEVVGRWLCVDARSGPTIFWTDVRFSLLAQVVGQAPEYERLVDFWTNEAGPIP